MIGQLRTGQVIEHESNIATSRQSLTNLGHFYVLIMGQRE